MYIHGERIRLRRKQLGLSQEELADRVKSQQKQISNWENNIIEPSTDSVYLLATTLNVSTDWLYGLTDFVRPFGEGDLSDNERELIDMLRSLSEDQREKFSNVLKALA